MSKILPVNLGNSLERQFTMVLSCKSKNCRAQNINGASLGPLTAIGFVRSTDMKNCFAR
jgi:hypothetical protein